jgi:hypothetical protein
MHDMQAPNAVASSTMHTAGRKPFSNRKPTA